MEPKKEISMPVKRIAAPVFTMSFSDLPFAMVFRRAVKQIAQRFSSHTDETTRILAIEDRIAIGSKKDIIALRCYGQRFLIIAAGDTVGPVIKVELPQTVRKARQRKQSMEREA